MPNSGCRRRNTGKKEHNIIQHNIIISQQWRGFLKEKSKKIAIIIHFNKSETKTSQVSSFNT